MPGELTGMKRQQGASLVRRDYEGTPSGAHENPFVKDIPLVGTGSRCRHESACCCSYMKREVWIMNRSPTSLFFMSRSPMRPMQGHRARDYGGLTGVPLTLPCKWSRKPICFPQAPSKTLFVPLCFVHAKGYAPSLLA